MTIRDVPIDTDYLTSTLKALLNISSPSGMTNEIVRHVCSELSALDIHHELTRLGAIRADLPGKQKTPDRAIIAHVDTLGMIVKQIKENGRLEVLPIGHWSSRFAEGARVTVHSDNGVRMRGTVLPLKASGHTFADEVDELPVNWQTVEVRLDLRTTSRDETLQAGINVGDTISVDAQPEFSDTGYVNARHLDDKAGVAAMLTAAKAVVESGVTVPVDCHLLFARRRG